MGNYKAYSCFAAMNLPNATSEHTETYSQAKKQDLTHQPQDLHVEHVESSDCKKTLNNLVRKRQVNGGENKKSRINISLPNPIFPHTRPHSLPCCRHVSISISSNSTASISTFSKDKKATIIFLRMIVQLVRPATLSLSSSLETKQKKAIQAKAKEETKTRTAMLNQMCRDTSC